MNLNCGCVEFHGFFSITCGDEQVQRGQRVVADFLNHLWGDEHELAMLENLVAFLNHLCGDER